MHDFFNILTAAILLPLELTTHYLERTAGFLASKFYGFSGVHLQSPLKVILNPAIKLIDGFFLNTLNMPVKPASICMLVFALVVLFLALIYIVKIMRALVIKRTEAVLDNVLGSNAVFVMIMGMMFTAIIQSSSVTTSIMVPLVASGILSMESAFPVTLGANMGTTITAMLAALTGNVAAITIAFAHFMFNLTGILLIYPIKAIRNIPLRMARGMAEIAYKKRWVAFLYVVTAFFVIPGLVIFISRATR